VRNPRTRLISFRLSEGEYRALQKLCDAREARSLSDFVRSVVRWMFTNGDLSHLDHLDQPGAPPVPGTDNGTFSPESGSNGWEGTVVKELLQLSRKTDALDREIRRLSLLVTKP
jgi:hypothetical protein